MKESGDDVKTGQDRNGTLDELLRRAVTADPAGTPAGACLDPETAAAWMEDSLRANERVAAEAHVADCSRCQALLGALARSEPAAAPARSGWRITPMRWLVPAGLTAAVGLAVFLLLPQELTRDAKQVAFQAARSEPTPGTTAGAPAPPAATIEMDARERAAAPSNVAPATPARKDAKSLARVDELKETRQAAAARDAISTRAKDVAQSKPDSAAAAAPSPAPPPPAAPVMALPAAPPPAVVQAPPPAANETLAKSNVQNRAGAAAGGVVGGAAGARAPADALRYEGLAEAVSITREAISPDPQSRWRIRPSSNVDRSTDGGRTWTTQDMPVHALLIAASAPTSSACWIVGKAGTVLLTVDGRTWQALAFPVAVDLVAVVATTADAATVTTADGRVFVTTDRGKTWTRGPV